MGNGHFGDGRCLRLGLDLASGCKRLLLFRAVGLHLCEKVRGRLVLGAEGIGRNCLCNLRQPHQRGFFFARMRLPREVASNSFIQSATCSESAAQMLVRLALNRAAKLFFVKADRNLTLLYVDDALHLFIHLH